MSGREQRVELMGHKMRGNQAEQCKENIAEWGKRLNKGSFQCHGFLTLGEKEETAEAHSSTSLRGLFGGSMWVLTNVGVLGDSDTPVRLFLGELILEPSPGTGCGYLVKSVLPWGGALLRSVSKLARRLAVRVGERDPGD